MPPLPLQPSAQRLLINLAKPIRQPSDASHLVHVADIGAGFYFAYEQLRNIAEYREHHLLLRSAIERYLKRYISIAKLEPFAADLITELTQAGYLRNDSVDTGIVESIDRLMVTYAEIATALTGLEATPADEIVGWINQLASARIEALLSNDPRGEAYMQFCYEHYFTAIDQAATVGPEVSDQRYRVALLCAIHHAIFKSDIATVRYHCLRAGLGELKPEQASAIAGLSKLVDELYQDPLTSKLTRLINRYAPPMRILRELVYDDVPPAKILPDRTQTAMRARQHCEAAYDRTQDQLTRRIVRTILFVLITKTVIGVSVEVPYDLAVYNEIAWQPLLINILFPPLYMAALGIRLTTPSPQNTEAIASFIDRVLYEGAGASIVYRPPRRRLRSSLRAAFRFVYAVGFVGSIALLVWILHLLSFNLVNGIIFFVFFSAVSFLGVRLRRAARELQLLDEQQTVFQAFIDFLSAPFVAIGRWLSDRYAKTNLITLVLDAAVEMPLKTFIRLSRQWMRFLKDKQDEL